MPRYAAGNKLMDRQHTPSERSRRLSDCPQRDGCMLSVHELIDEMRKEFTGELRETRAEMRALRTVLDNWLGSKGIRVGELTPSGRGLDISAGPLKLHGKAWTVAVVALLLAATLGTIAAGAYVLGQWGRPTAVPAMGAGGR